MTNQEQPETVRDVIVFTVKFTEIVPVGDNNHVQLDFTAVINGEEYHKVFDQQGSQMSVQHNMVGRELRWIAAEYPGSDVTMVTSDPFLYANMRNVLFHDQRMISNGYTQGILNALRDMGKSITALNSFELIERDVPAHLVPRYQGVAAGFGARAGMAPRVSTPQAGFQSIGRTIPPQVDRRFTSGEAAVTRQPVAPPTDDQLDIFAPDAEPETETEQPKKKAA